MQFNARFSTLMSERDSCIIKGLNVDKTNAFFMPKSFSHVPTAAPTTVTPAQLPIQAETSRSEFGPATQLPQN